jgi:3,4-dihydroxy-2-butanone 4-phosphate synthase
MMRMAMSVAAAGLLRELLRRAGVDRDRILLTELRSTDWQSLTFIGEQHRIRLRIPAPDSAATAAKLVNGLEDSEFSLPGHLVADIALDGELEHRPDGSVALAIEALTVEA